MVEARTDEIREFKVAFTEVYYPRRVRGFIDSDTERQVWQLIKNGALKEGGGFSKIGNVNVRLIKLAEVEGILESDTDWIILPTLVDDGRKIDPSALTEWVDWTGDFKELIRVLWIFNQVAMVGHKGTGKNKALVVLSNLFGLPYFEIPSSEDLTSYDLVGKYGPSASREKLGEWIDGILTDWSRSGGMLNWDEPNICRGGIILRTHSVFDFRRRLVLKEHAGEVVKRNRFAYLGLTFNPPRAEYLGAEILNIAFLDRFAVFEFDYPPEDMESKIIDKGVGVVIKSTETGPRVDTSIIVKIARRLREKFQAGVLHDTVSTRQLELARSLMDNGMSLEKAIDVTIVNRFYEDERVTAREIVRTTLEEG